MSYIKAEDVLPTGLIQEIQKYIRGENIYIPSMGTERCQWGEKSGYKEELRKRNQTIYESSLRGVSVIELAREYCLSEKSIYRIIGRKKIE